jgi:hypothetical protein
MTNRKAKIIERIKNPPTNGELAHRVAILERELLRLMQMVTFLGGDKIHDSKYRKAFPKEGDDPYFKAGYFPPHHPSAFRIGDSGIEPDLHKIVMPTEPQEYRKAWERSVERREQAYREGWPKGPMPATSGESLTASDSPASCQESKCPESCPPSP